MLVLLNGSTVGSIQSLYLRNDPQKIIPVDDDNNNNRATATPSSPKGVTAARERVRSRRRRQHQQQSRTDATPLRHPSSLATDDPASSTSAATSVASSVARLLRSTRRLPPQPDKQTTDKEQWHQKQHIRNQQQLVNNITTVLVVPSETNHRSTNTSIQHHLQPRRDIVAKEPLRNNRTRRMTAHRTTAANEMAEDELPTSTTTTTTTIRKRVLVVDEWPPTTTLSVSNQTAAAAANVCFASDDDKEEDDDSGIEEEYTLTSKNTATSSNNSEDEDDDSNHSRATTVSTHSRSSSSVETENSFIQQNSIVDGSCTIEGEQEDRTIDVPLNDDDDNKPFQSIGAKSNTTGPTDAERFIQSQLPTATEERCIDYDSDTIQTDDDKNALARATVQHYIDALLSRENMVLANTSTGDSLPPSVSLHDDDKEFHLLTDVLSETFDTMDIDPATVAKVREYIDNLSFPSKDDVEVGTKQESTQSRSGTGIDQLQLSTSSSSRGIGTDRDSLLSYLSNVASKNIKTSLLDKGKDPPTGPDGPMDLSNTKPIKLTYVKICNTELKSLRNQLQLLVDSEEGSSDKNNDPPFASDHLLHWSISVSSEAQSLNSAAEPKLPHDVVATRVDTDALVCDNPNEKCHVDTASQSEFHETQTDTHKSLQTSTSSEQNDPIVDTSDAMATIESVDNKFVEPETRTANQSDALKAVPYNLDGLDLIRAPTSRSFRSCNDMKPPDCDFRFCIDNEATELLEQTKDLICDPAVYKSASSSDSEASDSTGDLESVTVRYTASNKVKSNCLDETITTNGDVAHNQLSKSLDTILCDDKVITLPSAGSSDWVRVLGTLYQYLARANDVSDDELYAFGQLVRFSFPLLVDGQPTSLEVSKIFTKAEELHVTFATTDRLLHSSQAIQIKTPHEKGQTVAASRKDPNIIKFLDDLSAYFISQEVQLTKVEEKTLGEAAIVNSAFAVVDSFEVEINDGYSKLEYAPSADDEPWWVVVARLNTHPGDKENLKTESIQMEVSQQDPIDAACSTVTRNVDNKVLDAKDSSIKFEEDIAKYWKEREECKRDINSSNSKSFVSTDALQKVRVNSTASFDKVVLPTIQEMTRWAKDHKQEISKTWQVRQALTNSQTKRPKAINAVLAVSGLKKNKRMSVFPFSNAWRFSYAERTRRHRGFVDIDVYSLYNTSSVTKIRHSLDIFPWENRFVRQRFLYEQSISFRRNWFGCLTLSKGNRKIKEPVCRPKSMEMPMQAGEWTETWYKQPRMIGTLVSSVEAGDDSFEDDDDSWEETPECGKIKNVKLKIGERISRVTPDLTSSLRRSRWRKKHFPHGSFPYK